MFLIITSCHPPVLLNNVEVVLNHCQVVFNHFEKGKREDDQEFERRKRWSIFFRISFCAFLYRITECDENFLSYVIDNNILRIRLNIQTTILDTIVHTIWNNFWLYTENISKDSEMVERWTTWETLFLARRDHGNGDNVKIKSRWYRCRVGHNVNA